MKNKTASLYDYICENRVEFVVLTETWLFAVEEENTVYINSLLPAGFLFKHCPRPDGHRGGGVGLVYRDSIMLTQKSSSSSAQNKIEQFEFYDCILNQRKDPRSSIRVIIVYRPPPNAVNKLKLKLFWKEWSKFLSQYSGSNAEIVFVGDLNLHLDDSSLSSTKKFFNLIEEYSLTQHIKEPTHTAGHILDVLITKTLSKIMPESITVHDPGFSDNDGNCLTCHHFAIDFSFCYKKPLPAKKIIKYRNLKNIDIKSIAQAVNKLSLESKLTECDTVDDMVSIYSDSLKSILDLHAPTLTRTVTDRSKSPWFTSELLAMKSEKRKLERQWKKSKRKSDHIAYRQYCASYSHNLNKARVQKSLEDIEACENDAGRLFKLCKSLIAPKKRGKLQLAGCENDTQTAQTFADYFKCKVKNICKELDNQASTLCPETTESVLQSSANIPKLQEFEWASTAEIEQIVLKSNNKSCDLDIWPANLVKTLICNLSSSIAIIVNKSLNSGIVPKFFKFALVIPGLKQSYLDPNSCVNYRPLSNLPFLSKVLEKVVYSRLERHLSANNLLSP